jgi:hypothetical protein
MILVISIVSYGDRGRPELNWKLSIGTCAYYTMDFIACTYNGVNRLSWTKCAFSGDQQCPSLS